MGSMRIIDLDHVIQAVGPLQFGTFPRQSAALQSPHPPTPDAKADLASYRRWLMECIEDKGDEVPDVRRRVRDELQRMLDVERELRLQDQELLVAYVGSHCRPYAEVVVACLGWLQKNPDRLK